MMSDLIHKKRRSKMLTFNEDTRVKIPATIQFLRLNYNYQSLKTDDIDIDFNTKWLIISKKP